MGYGFAVSGYSLPMIDPALSLQAIRGAGFVGIEGFETMHLSAGFGSPADLRSLVDDHGMRFTSHHLPFGKDRDIAAFYETHRQAAVDAQSRSMEIAAELGAAVVIQHPASALLNIEVEDPRRYHDRLVKSLEALAPRAADLGIRIAVENMMQSGHQCYFGRPEHIAAINEAVQHPNVGFCLDTGHALISMGPGEEHRISEAMGDRLIAYHIQDNPGDRDMHIAPGRGNVDFGGVFARAASFEGVMCIETPPFTPADPEDEASMLSSWTQLLEETRALA